MDNQIAVFEQKKMRQIEHNGEMYFSVIDIIEALTDSPNPRNYWSMLKKRDEQLYTVCVQLKMKAPDGRLRETDCANTEGVLRIIMSVPSPKAEPFRMWLAQLGKREIDEISDPELGFDRLREIYQAKGYADEWIKERLQNIDTRKKLTDEWKNRGVKEGQEYSILTAIIAKGIFGISPTEHKNLKGLTKSSQNLRDHMTDLELILTSLGEAVTRTVAIDEDAQGFDENKNAAVKGGQAGGQSRRNVEKITGKKVVSSENHIKTTNKQNKLTDNTEQ